MFRTGVDGLDVALGGGFGPGGHVVLARHSAGSTTLALQVTEGANGKGLPVLLVGDDDFLRGPPRRLAALRAGVGLHPDGPVRDAGGRCGDGFRPHRGVVEVDFMWSRTATCFV